MNNTHIYLIIILLAIILVSVFISSMLEPICAGNREGLIQPKGTTLSTDLKTAIDNYPKKPGEGIRDLKKIQSKLISGMYPDTQNELRTKISAYLPNMINAEEQLAKNNVSPLDVKNTIDKIMSSNPKVSSHSPTTITNSNQQNPFKKPMNWKIPQPPQPPAPPPIPKPPQPPAPPQASPKVDKK